MRTGRVLATACMTMMLGGSGWAQSTRPDRAVTPGALNPAVTQETINATICVRGWTRTVRPPREYTARVKIEQLRAAGYADRRLRSYEEDHLIPLALGGAPYDVRNLWPQPRETADGWDADRKDELERQLNGLVCAGRVSLAEAQRAIAADWIAAYRRYVEGVPEVVAADPVPLGRLEEPQERSMGFVDFVVAVIRGSLPMPWRWSLL